MSFLLDVNASMRFLESKISSVTTNVFDVPERHRKTLFSFVLILASCIAFYCEE